MPSGPPPFYDDLWLSLEEVRSIIDGGARDRRLPAHSPVVATLDGNGAPSQRVMILRKLDWQCRMLRFHTDARSLKIEEITARNRASVLFYDPDAKVQIRLGGFAQIDASGAAADAAWQESSLFARRCYLASQAPGLAVPAPVSGLPPEIEGRQPSEHEVAAARANFAILLFHFESIEWLYLANIGHRRARWRWNEETVNWEGDWLIP